MFVQTSFLFNTSKTEIVNGCFLYQINEGKEDVSLIVSVRQRYRPPLCAIRLGVPSGQRPLHAGALRFPRWLLHVLSGPHGGRWRGEHLGCDLRRGLQPLGQRAAHTCGRAPSGGAGCAPSQRRPLQRGWGGVGGGGCHGIEGSGPGRGLWKEKRPGFG